MRIATLAIAFLLTAGCSKTVKVQTDPRTGRTDVDVQKPGEPQSWKGIITAVGTSGINGTATPHPSETIAILCMMESALTRVHRLSEMWPPIRPS